MHHRLVVWGFIFILTSHTSGLVYGLHNPLTLVSDNYYLEGNRLYLADEGNQNFDGNIVDEYLGVPYAEPPVGNLRFRSPRPASFYPQGSLKVNKFAASCVQSIGLYDPRIIVDWWDRSILVKLH